MSRSGFDYAAGDLFGEIYLAEEKEAPRRLPLRAYMPGVLLCATAALAAGFLARAYEFPLILLGLLIGLALSFMADDERTGPGLDFLSRHALRAGIVLLGLQVTFVQVGALGLPTAVGLLTVMFVAMLAAVMAARIFGQQSEAGVLAGGATAICGASAALALYGVIGRDRLDQARFSVTLVGVALASALAIAAAPILATTLGLTDAQAGFLIGATVHDAGQAIGGAYGYSDAAGQSGTIVKLARVALLAPVVALVALWLGRRGGGGTSRIPLPWFILGFLAVLAVNSAVAMPDRVAQVGLDLSKALLLLAVTATAIRSRLGLLLETGWRALMPIALASLASLAAGLAVAVTLIT
ncbi:YeiH family protein [Aurantiacibacter aquimixticola]|uniref:Putative sulfate exporter family transporter n=1 Tax=Aurantiacibacter aquimixticola TaxID=1958945 RepID=A0A419RW61_9SPHN|nr:putative sulfate exporter family transporter [Aurantiacibacter aquimixticola]RJY10026.1 putative sulfate exporter family transporter [Aurantiacibacter aquimixticola]